MRLACLNSEEIDSGYWHIKLDKEMCTSYTTSYDTVMCQTLYAVSLMTIYTLYRSHQGVVHTECEDIMRAIGDIDATFGSGCRPVRFVAHDIRNLPKFTPGELDNSSIFDRVCKLERQMASMQHAPTFASATRTQSLVTDEATDAAVTKRTEWQRQQRNLRMALPPPSTIGGACEDGEDSDDGFSLPARQQRTDLYIYWTKHSRNDPSADMQGAAVTCCVPTGRCHDPALL